MRRSKIIATLGPAADRPGVLAGMVAAGMDGGRINCSHGSPAAWAAHAAAVRRHAADHGRTVALLADLQGPKMRLATSVRRREVAPGDEVVFVAGTRTRRAPDELAVAWPSFADLVGEGESEIVCGDGTPRFMATQVEGPAGARRVRAVCVAAGRLRPRQGIAVTHARGAAPSMTDKDIADLDVVLGLGVEFVALSFVRSRRDVLRLRRELSRRRASDVRVVAKIEKLEAFDDLDEILAVSDGVMVARGDLGVEAGVARVPLLQKDIIHRASEAGRLVITATQMLESMVESPEPTRAEATDIANAIIDGTSAVMLSAETAVGRYPVQAVQAMAEIASVADQAEIRHASLENEESLTGAVMQAAVLLAQRVGAEALVVPTSSGGSARACAKYRPRQPVIAIVDSPAVAGQLALEWGVVPGILPHPENAEELIRQSLRLAQEISGLPDGARVVLTHGPVVARPGETNLIVVRRLGEA